MDIHRNNAFSLTAMEAAFTEGEEWLEQLLAYLSDNFDFVVDYCQSIFPRSRPLLRTLHISCGWTVGPWALTTRSSTTS